MKRFSIIGTILIRNKQVNFVFRILLTVLFFLAVNKSISYRDIAFLVKSITPLFLISTILAGIVSFYFQVVRWKYILQLRKLPSAGTIPLKTMLWGNLLGFLTPGRVGELFRGIRINSSRKADSIFAVFIDRLFAIIMVLLSGILCVISQIIIYRSAPLLIVTVSLSILVLIAGTGLIILRINRLRKVQLLKKLSPYFTEISSVITTRIILTSILAHLFLIIQTVLLLKMFGSSGWITNTIVAGQAYMQMVFLPFSIANVGIREYSFTIFISQLSDAQAPNITAFGVSNFILCINIVLPALAGLIWMIISRNNLSGETLTQADCSEKHRYQVFKE